MSAIYISIVALLFVADIAIFSIVDYGNKPPNFVGCYAYDAMFIGFECSGFLGAKQLGLALNFPLYHLYMPFFILLKPSLIFAVVAMWFFPMMFILSNGELNGKST